MILAQSMPPNRIAAEQVCSLLEASPAIGAPWRYAALAGIRNLEEAGQRRPGQGDFRVAESTSSHARQILAGIDMAEIPTPTVAPISGGGLAISWNVGRREVQLSFFPDGELVYLKSEGDTILNPEEDDVAPNQAHYVNGLKWLLGRES